MIWINDIILFIDPKSPEIDVYGCQPLYLGLVQDCAMTQIFLNLTNFKDSVECDQVKQAIVECSNNDTMYGMSCCLNFGQCT